MSFAIGVLVTLNIFNMIIEVILFIKYIELYNQVDNMFDNNMENIRDIGDIERRLDKIENPPRDQGEYDGD